MAAMAMSLRFEIFPPDLDATVDFYTRVLRFELAVDRRTDPEPYVQLQRDGVLVGAARRPDVPDGAARRPPTGVEGSCWRSTTSTPSTRPW